MHSSPRWNPPSPPAEGQSPVAGWRDFIALALIAAFAAAISAAFNLSERLFAGLRHWEWLQVDELPLVLLAVAASLAFLARYRRGQALRELRARREAEGRLQSALLANRELAQAHLHAQEGERHALARELHDELGQYLNAIKLDAVGLRSAGADAASVQATSRQIIASVDHVHAVVGAMIGRLRPAALDDLGLAAALEACVEAWRRRLPQVRFELTLQGALDDLGETLSVAIYRIAQEGLTNAVRHSGADLVRLQVLREQVGPAKPDVINLRVQDDGQGASEAAMARGFGLRGICERAELLGGHCRLATRPGSGFAIDVSLPAVPAES